MINWKEAAKDIHSKYKNLSAQAFIVDRMLAKRDAIIERQAEEIRLLRGVVNWDDRLPGTLFEAIDALAEFDRKKEQEKH